MASTPNGTLIRQMQRTYAAGRQKHCSDVELLKRIQRNQDSDAMEEVIHRHGPMVLAAARKVLRHSAECDDVFQATFLLAFRKSQSLRQKQKLGSWLYGIAHRLAVRVRDKQARHSRLIRKLTMKSRPETVETTWQEACGILHEELDRLADRYRLPLLLCYLEGLSRDEAAHRLGRSLGSVKADLERGRQRLRNRLIKRGVTLSAGLFSMVAGPSLTAGTVPLPLVHKTISAFATVPAVPVAKLIWGVGLMTSLLTATRAIILVSLAALVGWCLWPSSSEAETHFATEGTNVSPITVLQDKPDEDNLTIQVSGQVVDAEGKGIAAASVSTPSQKPESESFPWTTRSTDETGRFAMSVPLWGKTQQGIFTVSCKGYAMNWVELAGKPADAKPRVIRMQKEQPIQAQLVDVQNKPLAGVKIWMRTIYRSADGKLESFLEAWRRDWQTAIVHGLSHLDMPLHDSAVTDQQGKFELKGVASDDMVRIVPIGSGMAREELYLMNRPGFDPKPYNEAVKLSRTPPAGTHRNIVQLAVPGSALVVRPSGLIEGQVLDAVSQQPISGVIVSSIIGYGNTLSVVTDQEGRYRLDGLTANETYELTIFSRQGSSYLSTTRSVNVQPGQLPQRIDFKLSKGVYVSGRVLDKLTGKGVKAGVRLAPAPGNTYFGKPGYESYRNDATMRVTDNDGRFRIAAIPGRSLLMAQVSNVRASSGQQLCPYRAAEPDPQFKNLFTKTSEGWFFKAVLGNAEILDIQHAVKVVELPEAVGEIKVDLPVDPGKTAHLVIHDQGNQPVAGVFVSGLAATWPMCQRVNDSSASILAMLENEPRTLHLLHPEKKLGAVVSIKAGETLLAKLEPLASIKGRCVDEHGKPSSKIEVYLNPTDRIGFELYRFARGSKTVATTDEEGRFELAGIVPDMKFRIGFRRERSQFSASPEIGLKQFKAGAMIELGEIKLAPRPMLPGK